MTRASFCSRTLLFSPSRTVMEKLEGTTHLCASKLLTQTNPTVLEAVK